jgi:hypothetical protein
VSKDRPEYPAAKMPKEKGYNPVQAQRKAEKAKAVKKGTAPLFDVKASWILPQADCRVQAKQRLKREETRDLRAGIRTEFKSRLMT